MHCNTNEIIRISFLHIRKANISAMTPAAPCACAFLYHKFAGITF